LRWCKLLAHSAHQKFRHPALAGNFAVAPRLPFRIGKQQLYGVPAIRVCSSVAVRFVCSKRMQQCLALAARVDRCRHGEQPCHFGCRYPVEAIRKPVGRLIKVDVDGRECLALFHRLRILADDCLGERDSSLGALSHHTVEGEHCSHSVFLYSQVQQFPLMPCES
jgi:hypothetical protein